MAHGFGNEPLACVRFGEIKWPISPFNSRCFSANIETNISLGNICQSNRSIIEMNIEDIRMCQLKKKMLICRKNDLKIKDFEAHLNV